MAKRRCAQFINRLDRETARQLGELPKDAKPAARTELEERRQTALALWEQLRALGETSERQALLGGFHKRSAQLATNRRIAQSHLKKAYAAYNRSWELVKEEKGSAGFYSATARLTFGYI